jgi:hypothetical protein
MAHAILLPNEFDINNVNFMAPKQNKQGGQSVLLNYSSDDKVGPFFMQTCRVRIPFGVDQLKAQGSTEVKYHISISLANEETENAQLKTFTDNIRDIDNKTRKYSQDNELWFGKKLKPEMIEDYYKSAEKFPKDKSKWPSNLKVKLPFVKGKPTFVLYDENKNPIDIVDEDGNMNLDSIPRGSEAVLLIQSTGVWFVGKNQFGVGYKLVQAKIYKSNKLSGYSIVDEEEVDEDDIE